MSADDVVEEKPRRRRKRRGDDGDEADAVIEQEQPTSTLTERKGRATPSRRGGSGGQQVQSGNFVTNTFRGIREYFAGVQDEMSKVVWPEREDLIRLTRMVMAVVILTSIALGALSLAFTELFRFGLNGNEWAFLVFFGIVSVIAVVMQRAAARRDRSTPYK